MACGTFCRTRKRSLPPSRSCWWMSTAVLFSVSAAAALAFQAPPSSQHHSTTTPAVSRLCRGDAYRARGSWSFANVEARPAGSASQRRYRRSDPAATTTTTAVASMAPGAGVLAQEEDDRTRCVYDGCCVRVVSSWQPGVLSPWLFCLHVSGTNRWSNLLRCVCVRMKSMTLNARRQRARTRQTLPASLLGQQGHAPKALKAPRRHRGIITT